VDQFYVDLYEIARAEKLLKKHGIVNAMSKSAQKGLEDAVVKVKKEKKEKKEKEGKGNGVDKN
jgi:hypothetical protein